MKNLRWIVALGILAFCSAYALADGVPPDGAVGTARGGKSTPIASLNMTFTFSSCATALPGSDTAFDCNLFNASLPPGAPQVQEVFAGINETGFAWNSLSISLTGLTPTDISVGCNGGTQFSIDNCHPNPIPIPESGSVVVSFLQGTGTGIGCFNTDLAHPLLDPANQACLANSAAIALGNSQNGTSNPYYNPPLTGGCNPPSFFPPGAVCGDAEFVIGVGINGLPFSVLPAGGTLIANSPEPQTILLVGGAMISMLMLGLKKARLV